MLSLVLLLFLLYFLLLANYTYQWSRIPSTLPPTIKQQRRFTVLVPARNEENNIGALLEAVQGLSYPRELIEIIVIDDGSADQTPTLVQQYPSIQLIRQNNDEGPGGKKKAIEAGVLAARHEWILTIDADSIPPSEWITTLNTFLDREEMVCVVGPVSLIQSGQNMLQAFQRYNHLMFQGITGAAIESGQHALGNGANLCYRKDAFETVGGFQGIDQLASGDDVLLIEKFMNRFPGQIHFLKSSQALVKTQPCPTWKSLWQQRVRWVSKAGRYKNRQLLFTQWATGLFNVVLLINSLACFIWPSEWRTILAIWGFKSITEWLLIRFVAAAYRERVYFLPFLLLQPVHAVYLVAVGLLGRGRKYAWKGRTVR
ncbi:MAG: glycosyltransferase [Bacteroidetes bacterium]|nr:glycosyltransferase [Bacteroidota bacterium]